MGGADRFVGRGGGGTRQVGVAYRSVGCGGGDSKWG